MSHTVAELESLELSVSELDEEVVGESSEGSSCLRVTLIRFVVVVLPARGRLVLMGTLSGKLENVSEPKEPDL